MKKHWQEIRFRGETLTVVYGVDDVEYTPPEPRGWDSPGFRAEVWLKSATIEETGEPATEDILEYCQHDNDFYEAMLMDIETDINQEEHDRIIDAADYAYQSLVDAKWEAMT